jgi:hypothetical protein
VVSADVHVVDGTDLFFYFVMSCLVFLFLFLIHATAVGKCFAEKLNKLDYAISSYKRAYRHQDHEGIAAFQLGELYHQKYKKNKKDGETRHLAATYYSKHVEMHDEEGIRGGDGYVSFKSVPLPRKKLRSGRTSMSKIIGHGKPPRK